MHTELDYGECEGKGADVEGLLDIDVVAHVQHVPRDKVKADHELVDLGLGQQGGYGEAGATTVREHGGWRCWERQEEQEGKEEVERGSTLPDDAMERAVVAALVGAGEKEEAGGRRAQRLLEPASRLRERPPRGRAMDPILERHASNGK